MGIGDESLLPAKIAIFKCLRAEGEIEKAGMYRFTDRHDLPTEINNDRV